LNLRKLEISGFKSFMSPLDLTFSNGITAILGPNGCGKSNVVDSIRWVLGEQRTRMLRNTKMENVLFNGTRLRKPLGMAEVYLTLTNQDHGLNLEFEEVTIGRRLYRNGTSEYLVNGEPVRLKQIRGLLVDTGLGNSAYSIIERDMIDKVLSDKESDKRNLLEEAAGVMRYRIQREEAERKIKATEQDLVRLVDILQELDKELRSLKYQMGKARRYQRLKERADELETVVLKATLYEYLQQKAALVAERERHQSIRLADENEIAIRDNRLEKMRIETAEYERRLQELHEKRYAQSSALQQHEEKIAIHNERISQHRARIVEDSDEVRRARERLEGLAQELEGLGGESSEKKERLEEMRRALEEKESALGRASRRLEEAREALRNKKQLALDLLKEKAKEKGVLEHIEGSIIELTDKQDTIESQLDDLSQEEANRVEELAEIEGRAAAQHRKLRDLQNDLTRLTESLDRTAEEAARCEREHSDAVRLHAKLTEKQEFLERIKQEHTRWSDETLERFPGLCGVLADFVRVERRFRSCFEACLSPILKGVVAGNREDAIECLAEFRGHDTGRVQILFPDRFAVGETPPSGDGVIGAASSLIECDASVVDYINAYLSGVVVVEDVETALRLLQEGRAHRVSTLDGVFFDGPGRIIVAGADDIEMTILEYETKLEELHTSLDRAHVRERRLEQRSEELAREREGIQREIGTIRSSLADEEKHYEALIAGRRDAELHLVRVKQRITSLEEAIAETKSAIRQSRERLQASHESTDLTAEEATDADLASLEERALMLERDKEAVSEVVARLRLDEVSLSGEVVTVETKIRNAEKIDSELRALIQAREEDEARCREQVAMSEEDVATLRSSIEVLHGEKDAVEKEIESTGERYSALKVGRDDLEKELKEMKDQRDAKRENLERVSVEMATLETRISGLVDKAQENFGQDLDRFVRDPSLFVASEWEGFDRGELDDIKQQLESFGPVNMLALEEHEEKKERFDFLSRQKDDLEEAKNSLSQAIRRINKEARRLLNETFEKVRENFKQTFLTLFDGGEVDLMWVDSDDPLEANLKIVANPKGKRLHDISSLSSGERALVALSLLFGIYLVKPSPFCVFDEVDAPLDDANVARFVRLLKSFTDHTQFIVITHNKKTMEAADNLYGVTMEEPGVSKLISVHLDDAERFKHTGVARTAAQTQGAPASA